MNLYKTSQYIEVLEDIDIESEKDFVLIFSTKSGKLLTLKREFWNDLKNNNLAHIPLDVIHQLIDNNVIVYKGIDEIKECLDENDLMIEDLRKLSFTIQPSANCQLGCIYCGQTHSNKKMEISTMDKILDRIQFLISKKGKKFYGELSITWYGGEPLMAYKEILGFSKKLIKFANEKTLKYSADIITNGLSLKPDYLERLINDAKIYHYQITIDGLAKTHDKRRPTKGGEETFNVIMNNIVKATKNKIFIDKDCRIALRINIDKNNYSEVPQLIKTIASLNLQKYITLNFAAVVDWGGNEASKESLDKKDFAEMEIDWILEAIGCGFEIANFLPTRSPVCMITNPVSEVYDAYGFITPCYEMNYTKMYENTAHIIGNLSNLENINLNSPLRKWHQMLKENQYECTKCKYLPVCGGSCPKDWLKNEPPCPTYKYNLKDRMMLEFLTKKGELKKLLQL